jgi:cytochrome c oxidase subunit 2
MLARSFWLPDAASTVAADVDWNWSFVYGLSVFFLALVTFLMLYFAIRYRGRDGQPAEGATTHNTPLEIVWSVIPTGVVIAMFWNGYTTYLDLENAPRESYELRVTGQKWNWLFTYPNGYVDGELHVPAHTPVSLIMTSEDVIHAFFVPEFRVKRDVMPGRYTKVWFEATTTGEYKVMCAEYCGTSHSTMLAKVVVHAPGEYDAWLREASDFLKRMSPEEAGALLYAQRGCKQCHSLDGSVGTGPSFRGLWGAHRAIPGHPLTVDENYVRESILQPTAKVSPGFQPVMPTYQGRISDPEISAIIAYLKTLSDGS